MLRLLGRLLLVGFACLSAAGATAFVLFTLGLERLTRAAHGASADEAMEWTFDFAWTSLPLLDRLLSVPGMVVLAALALVAVGEIARIRSVLYYVAGGGLVLASAALLVRGSGDGASLLTGAAWQVLATAGFAGGLVYWVLAGRRA